MNTENVLGQDYRPRVIDTVLAREMATTGAVIVEGARAAGKTMSALHAAASYIFIDTPRAQQLIDIAPESVLDGDAPRLIDEWQVAPQLWNMVRRRVDAAAEPGQFILTGSAIPADDVTRHTGAGRFLRIRQRTMSRFEMRGEATAPVSLTALFDGDRPRHHPRAAPDLDDVIESVLRPGFPALTGLTPEQAARQLRGYIDDVSRADVHRIADVRHSPAVITQLIAAVARSIASDVSYRTLANDTRSAAPTITVETVSTYVDLLKRLFLVEEQAPWTPTLRSRARLRRSPKLHLVDPALAAAALGTGRAQLRGDLSALGLLFESAVVHDLTVFATALDAAVKHYRDSNGKEADAIITLPDGRWGAVEVKLGGAQITAGAASLRDMVAQVDDSAGPPAFRLVVTGTGPILTTDDGTVTAPLAALGP